MKALETITPSAARSNGHHPVEAKPSDVQISAPNIQTAMFQIRGTAPLVIHRFDVKVMDEFRNKIEEGTKARGKKRFAARSTDDICEAAKYFGKTNGEKWEGFNAASIRLAMISACRGANFKMTIIKQCLFCEADGYDINTPLIPLIRIEGESVKTEMVARTETGTSMLTIRPMYNPWSAKVRLRYDASMLTVQDVGNLLLRAGQCVGIGEGRPDSKNSGGMGWGTFTLE